MAEDQAGRPPVTDLLAHGEADLAQPAVGRLHLDVDRETAPTGGEGHRDNEPRPPLVEPVRGDDEDRQLARLLVPTGRFEIG
jgi:hypothetical protein